MINFEKIRSMPIDKLADWLNEYGPCDNAIWVQWFDETYCKKCEPVIDHYEDAPHRDQAFAWCEIERHCRYFPDMDEVPSNVEIIKMWLNQEEEHV